MNEFFPRQVTITDDFWSARQRVNAREAIFHQWEQLELSHSIDNFRITAGQKTGFREGWFFADSDAYKWLEAAANIYTLWPSNKLKLLMDDFLHLVGMAQADDGYLFTYNQLHFPDQPHWQNPLIEHELYCHGHLIEAGVSHFQATGSQTALDLACRAADLLVSEFLTSESGKTSGHEEIEIALLRLFRVTDHGHYLELARQFLERRGKYQPISILVLLQNARANQRSQVIHAQRQLFRSQNPGTSDPALPPNNYAKSSRFIKFRWQLNALSGKYFQLHAPIRKQFVPVGHAVRFAYLETAIAMLYREDHDQTLLPALKKAWNHMVTRRMYVTGGIGSLPELEGFGRDYELDPEIAYAETCAALGSMFWNWQMTLSTAEACYADLFEWQAYNAALVGMGLGGDKYLYNNPLACRGEITRRPWFMVPCCPSNLSRTWAALGKYIFSAEDDNLWVHQYIGCHAELDGAASIKINLQSNLPWDGKIRLVLNLAASAELTIWFRIPSWVDKYKIIINGQVFDCPVVQVKKAVEIPATGIDPRLSSYLPIRRTWNSGDEVAIEFSTPIMLRKTSNRIRNCRGKIAITRGPLVYCLESCDNPGLDLFTTRLDPASLQYEFSPNLLEGTGIITGKTREGLDLIFIPYHLWANRGESLMNTWINI